LDKLDDRLELGGDGLVEVFVDRAQMNLIFLAHADSLDLTQLDPELNRSA
jgi:hypothetical protein